jgi:hypothetical protein
MDINGPGDGLINDSQSQLIKSLKNFILMEK